jgi:hypothetical protein
MHPLDAYLQELYAIHATGAAVRETSYYGPLANLLNEVGGRLRPRVRCVINLRNRGAGIPDGGLFTADQLQRGDGDQPRASLSPARGAIEAKGTDEDVMAVARGEQVSRYLGAYGQVLVTNYRDFVLVGFDSDGQSTVLETFRLAKDERAFWRAAGRPESMVEEQGEHFLEYLTRVMLHAARLTAPEELAWFLASYARDALARIQRAELPALNDVRAALEESLGLSFQGERGERFFRSTLVQTLFYGVFSAWVLWSKRHSAASGASRRDVRFRWREATWSLRVPMIRALFEQIATPHRLGPLGLVEVLDWTETALNRVDRTQFFARFEEDHAVQYFYEPFLEAFDPELRKELGVWYTPPEIVRYMVARVHRTLQSELGLADGLADPNVYVLDPCCGTGAYLVEVLRTIDTTLRARGDDALRGDDLKRAAMQRVFGFEILPAPFVVAHLQLGLLLQQLGAPLAGTLAADDRVSEDRRERVGVYLTNALTGWEPEEGPQRRLAFPELEEERDAADQVKQATPILVILGNPPYNGFAGVAVAEERDLTTAYRTTVRAPAPQGQGLNDLYVRFYRMAERRIVDGTGRGVVCFISNYSWLDGLSFTGMRERYLDAFDGIWIDNLNGDSFRTGKLTPEGEPDPSIFSTAQNREGIRVGTAITLLVRKERHAGGSEIGVREFWGVAKRADLERSIEAAVAPYETIAPAVALGYPFTGAIVDATYLTWPLLTELFPTFFPGVQTKRDEFVVDIDRDQLLDRLSAYFDPDVTNEEMRQVSPRAMESTNRFDAPKVRAYLRQRGFLPQNVVRYCYRPLDLRWVYWEPETKLLGEKSPEYFPQVFEGNAFLVTQQKPRRGWSRPQVISRLGNLDLMDRSASCFPLWVRAGRTDELKLYSHGSPAQAGEVSSINLSPRANSYISTMGVRESPTGLFHHATATLQSPAYSREHSNALRHNWPRIPLPASRDQLLVSSALGEQLAALLDPERPVEGVTAGAIPPELRAIGAVSRVGGGSLDANADLAVTARWGVAGKNGVTMPGRGKLTERDYTAQERAAVAAGAERLGLTTDATLALLGERTYDVYLNDVAYWRNVPAAVWEYTLGGYQVMKKWLSYRERALLGRPLTVAEVREVTAMARRIAAILLLTPALDASYAATKAHCYAWPGAIVTAVASPRSPS